MKINLGWCVTGSFCTFEKAFAEMEKLSEFFNIIPIMSFNAATINCRFGEANEHISTITRICGNKPITTIEDAEPLGPQKMTDIMLIAPCTGNTLAKLANSITDTPVTMAVKSHLRNNKPVVIALSTNDALAGTMKNLGTVMNLKNYYFVPLTQDDPKNKPSSLVADLTKIQETISLSQKSLQFRPFLVF
ncbi:MAG: dipicolinate synthase subunit B [Oscillospiraceae bacterium]|jgi:dipicolinate synthase subunit B|nr:dipicolinate synthase subunit B [Oscillospiraceae bacterium]